MAPREELVSSAVTFLQDPSVSSAPVEKRIEFLKSKNLTEEEIEVSLARAAGEPSQYSPSQNAPYYPPAQQQIRGPPSQRYPYPYNPYGEWQQPPPPEPPRRDWRDYFIMATVVGGASYGLYVLAQRYIKPLIAPPTPPQLEQDKAAIDEQFNRAFALLDTLSSDTASLKEAEEARTARLDSAIGDIESIVADLKAANMRREDDARRMESEIKSMKDSLPRSIDSVKDASERQLKELSTELASLKMLMGNRMGGSSNYGSGVARTQPATLPTTNTTTNAQPSSTESTSAPANPSNPARQPSSYGATTSPYTGASAAPPSSSTAPRPASTSFSNTATKPTIPSWQMAAQNKAKEASAASANGTSSAADGADAVAALTAS
ncbi:hypothetical protein B0A52_02658 [Exophiala mesophila]|uniref:Peroxisomal membrane protein PEX14 n=1 Tax=Exophiala mesophila TaxID=212818 RepID=A0A438NDJ7_EXOME|nr:hypothetical protein B0A52_02658 [Exophiala mesophila]